MKLIKLLLPILFLTFTIVEVNAQKVNKKMSISEKLKQKRKGKITPPPPPEYVEPVIADESPVPFFIAGGEEPNWNIELLQGMDASLEAKIVMDYGEKQYKTQLFKQVIKLGDSFREIYINKPNGKDKNVYEVQITHEVCQDEAHNKHDARILLKINDLSYESCGDYAKNMQMELNGKFIVVAINGIKTNKTNSVEIDVFRRQISANMGCNMMSGSFFASKNEVKPLVLAATRMMCNDMKLEQDFGTAVGRIRTYTSSDYGIFFLDENKKKILELKRL
jgi:heat shock protein HslJ